MRISGALLLVGMAACQPSAGSIELRFPNEEARRGVLQLEIDIYSESGSLADVTNLASCSELTERASGGSGSGGDLKQVVLTCPLDGAGQCEPGWFTEERPIEIPTGRSVVHVRGYSTTGSSNEVTLEGCTEAFDTTAGGKGTERVPVDMKVVLPNTARLTLAGTNRFSGPPGELSPVPLRVRVQGSKSGSGGGTYGIPGVRVSLSSEAALLGAEGAKQIDRFTGQDGIVEVPLRFADEAVLGRIVASAEALFDPEDETRARRVLVASSIVDPGLSVELVAVGADVGRPMALAAGRFRPGGPKSIAALGCSSEFSDCKVGIEAEVPFGRSRLTGWSVGADGLTPMGSPVSLGIIPADLEFLGNDEGLAVLESRRESCQARVCTDPETCPCFANASGVACPCEGSLVHFVGERSGALELVSSMTLTASNAVAMEAYVAPDGLARLAIAGQGRSRNDRRCANVTACLRYDQPHCLTNPEMCGCPPDEACDCVNCDEPPGVGRCIAKDRMIDVLAVETSGRVFNDGGCQLRNVTCNSPNPRGPEGNHCSCEGPRGEVASCSARDKCGCSVPSRIHTGASAAPSLTFQLTPARLRPGVSDDLVGASESGLELFRSSGNRFTWDSRPSVNEPILDVVAANFDPAAELDRGGPPLDDFVWNASGSCLRGVGFEAACPIVLADEDEAEGCFGMVSSDGIQSYLVGGATNRTPERCRRFDLPRAPVSMCSGDVDGNGTPDVALGLSGEAKVRVHLTDRYGGIRFPAIEAELPAGTVVGPMVCDDLDGDGRSEVVTWAGEGAWLAIIRAGR